MDPGGVGVLSSDPVLCELEGENRSFIDTLIGSDGYPRGKTKNAYNVSSRFFHAVRRRERKYGGMSKCHFRESNAICICRKVKKAFALMSAAEGAVLRRSVL